MSLNNLRFQLIEGRRIKLKLFIFVFPLLLLQERGVQQICAAQDVIPCGARRRVSVQTAHVRRIGGPAQWRPQVIDH